MDPRTGRARRSESIAVVVAGLAAFLPGAVGAVSVPQALAPRVPASTTMFQWVAPNDGPPAVNRRHAGTWVRIRFSVGGDFGMDILREGWPKARQVDCRTGDPVAGTLGSTHLPGTTGLRYEAQTGTYTYAWRVPAAWGGGPGGGCREFLVKLDDGSVHSLDFRFDARPRNEPTAGMECADIVDGTGQYISLDPVTQDPLPEPRADFVVELGAPSCTGGAPTVYQLRIFEGAEGEETPTWPLRIATGNVTGDGGSSFVTFSVPIEGDAPDAICALVYVRRGGVVLERAPDWPLFSCAYALDEGPPGRSGFE
jgi:hypothetical protein